jgi:hypothetical protein
VLQLFATKIKTLLIDWLIAFVGIVLILWFAFTLPIFSISKTSVDADSININQANLKSYVEALSNYYAPRTIEFGNLNATGSYIHAAFSKFGDAQYQSYKTLSAQYKNVLLKLGPDTDEILVIGAHYDAKNDSLDIDGNASGVAALIELAHQFSENEDKLSIGVQLVAYPLSQKKSVTIQNMGSYQHARFLSETGKSVKMMFSLDSVGSYTNKRESQNYPYKFMRHVYPDQGNYISLVGRLQDYSDILQFKKSFKQASKLPVYSFSAPASYTGNSVDHLNYQRYGFPAMMITDTAEYRVFEEKKGVIADRLDYKKMAMLVEGLYRVVLDNKSPKRTIELAKNSSNKKFSLKIDEIQ